jgi:DNA-binding CsgD family transcriptional regulator
MLRRGMRVVDDGPDLRGIHPSGAPHVSRVQDGDGRNNTVEFIQGRGLGKRKEDLVEENIADVSIDHKKSMAVPQAVPGIMLLTASMQLLYKDQRAGELCQQIIRSQDGKTAHGVVPPAVVSLVHQIRKTLTVRTDPKDWEQIQLRCVVNTLHSSVLLCGTALIDQTYGEKRILIVMNETGISAWQDKVLVQAREKFHLTARETMVVHHLLKGWTNKEIANKMRVAEQTVKEHLRHISKKTRATTRTGIVMKIIHSGLRYALAPPSPHDVIVPTLSGMPIELVGSA